MSIFQMYFCVLYVTIARTVIDAIRIYGRIICIQPVPRAIIREFRIMKYILISVGPAPKNVILNSPVAPNARYELTMNEPKTGTRR